MIDQNLSQANSDFSFYDNENDEFQPNLGSLLPLWVFSTRVIRGLPVTGIAWSEHFVDLFAVGYKTCKEEDLESDEDDLGLIREAGCICLYSLKGPAHPEKIIQFPFAVRCLSFHPGWSNLLAAGCEGGVISIYDLRREENCPVGINKMTEKMLHQDTVSSLRWLPDVLPQKFCTVSSDGQVLSWLFLMNELFPFEKITSLQAKDWDGEVPPVGIEMIPFKSPGDVTSPTIGINMAGISLSVNRNMKDLFAVGTETGVIYECSFEGKSRVRLYEDHKNSVISIHWNSYHPRVFLSCSEDMTVRIWDHTLRESLFEFFFDNEVRDACWAPFSSTLFAAISGNAVVHVFDLEVNKSEAIGTYVVYTAKEAIRLTTLCFHPVRPVLLVGDERGKVTAFKLSPNLRSSLKARESLDESSFIAKEVQKMEKLLAPAKGRIRK